MAVSIPREVFTLGAVQFDTSRLANLEGQILAKREAKRQAEQEAIDKYMMEQGGKLTPTGVRTDDLPGFEERRKAWVDFSLKNKSQIKSDPLIRAEADRLFNNTLAYIQASKNEEEKVKPAKTMLADPTKRNQLNTEAVIRDIALHDLPLDNPNRKSIDYNAAWYRPASFDFNDEFAKAAKNQPKSFLRVIPGSTNMITGNVETEQGWTPASIKAIANNFVRSVQDNSDKYEYYVRRAKQLTPAQLVELNKELTGTGLVADDDNPLAVAYAEAVQQAKSAIDVVEKADTELAQRRAITRASIRKSEEKGEEVNFKNYDILGQYTPTEKKSWLSGVSRFAPPPIQVVYKKDISSEHFDLITNNGKVNPIYDAGGDYFIVRPDGDWEGEGGQIISAASVARSNLDKTSLSEEKRMPKKKENSYLINGTTYSEKELIKMGYTLDEIKPFLKK
jgi:hypothetical protein